MNAPESKPGLRGHFGKARDALSTVDIARFSERVAGHLLPLPDVRRARRVAVYLALPHEVQTAALIRALRDHGAGLCIPVFDPACAQYRFANLPDDESGLTRGPHGIPQPLLPDWVAPDAIDTILVPGLAFAPDGTRLGHGAGIYDRLLAESPATRIGIAFGCQLAQHLPAEPHDMRMHWIVTEQGAQPTSLSSRQKHETTTQ